MNNLQPTGKSILQDTEVSVKKLSPLKAIRAKCLDCAVYQPIEVRLCHISDCALHPYRMGKNFSRKGLGNRIAFPKKSLIESAVSLKKSREDIGASVASTQINSSTQLMRRKEK